MTNLKSAIESILIDSNKKRIDEESSGRSAVIESSPDDSVKNSSSLISSHIAKEDIVETPSEAPVVSDDRNLSTKDGEDPGFLAAEPDRLRAFLVNPQWESKINSMMDSHICDLIKESSHNITKKPFSLLLRNHRTLEVNFDQNIAEVSLMNGGFISGSELIYVDYHDLKVDFLILRKKDSGLEDATKHYKVLLNNELVQLS